MNVQVDRVLNPLVLVVKIELLHAGLEGEFFVDHVLGHIDPNFLLIVIRDFLLLLLLDLDFGRTANEQKIFRDNLSRATFLHDELFEAEVQELVELHCVI